jgi:hypothetical protein
MRSGLGLFFIVLGCDEKRNNRIYLARFPADNGILAEESETELRIEFLEKVFMKSAHSYKAVVYEGNSVDADFWDGKAVDKQISNNAVAISGYWISEFLQSDFKTTPEIGTRRLATALREAIRKSQDLEIKEELTCAATLARNLSKQVITIDNFAERMSLSSGAKTAMLELLTKQHFAFAPFRFSTQEFKKHIGFRQLQLNNGALLSAPAGKFDQCFQRTQVQGAPGEVEISTRGKIVDESLRKDR